MLKWQIRLGRGLNAVKDWLVAQFAFVTLKFLRLFPFEKSARIVEAGARFIGPRIPRHRVGMANLRLAFPKKSDEELQRIATDSWAQLARTAFEYVHLDRLFDVNEDDPALGRIEFVNEENFIKLRDDGLPAIIFTGHFANWELLPISASKYDLVLQSLFRAPNNKLIAKRLAEARNLVTENLVASGPGAAFKLAAALQRNEHVGLLVDQKFNRGIKVPFFGHPAWTNPLLAKLARVHECPVYGARVIRLPDGRFRIEIIDQLDLPRDAEGLIDIEGTTALVTSIVENWVREYPEQWLWFHRRWGE